MTAGGSVVELAPGVSRIGPGVHALALPLPDAGLKAINVYVVEVPAGLVLIDGGWASDESWQALVDGLAVLGASPADITDVLVTHAHRDHYPQSVELRRRFGTRVALSLGEQATLHATRDRTVRALEPQIAQVRAAGDEQLAGRLVRWRDRLQVDPAEWEDPDRWLQPGPLADLPFLTAISTPGHTGGHLCFVDLDRGLLYAGDHVLPHITPSIGFQPVRQELPLAAYLRSLALVRELPDLRLLPGHGPAGSSVHDRVDELLSHHRDRLGACLALVETGVSTAGEVARLLAWTRRDRAFAELDDFNQMLATCETAAHLDVLVADEVLAARQLDGVVHYTPTS